MLENKWSKSIRVQKLETLSDALNPQERMWDVVGVMLEDHEPKVGHAFVVCAAQVIPIWHSSTVTEIISQTDEEIVFKTLNSKYRLTIL